MNAGQVNTIKIAIADTADQVLDSAVFIEGGTFSTLPPPNVVTPEPGSLALPGAGLVGLAGAAKRFRR